MWYRKSITIPIETLVWNGMNYFGNLPIFIDISFICIAESKSFVSLQRVHFSVEKRKSKDASYRCSASFAFIVIPLGIAQGLNLSVRYVEKRIKELKELGLIERIGSKTKGGGWRIVEK